MRRLLPRAPNSPWTTSDATSEIVSSASPPPRTIKLMVKIRPPASSGWTSVNPTVVSEITVM